MDGSDGQKRFEAGRNTLLTHHQAAVLLLEPSKRPLGLKPWDRFFDRPASVLLGLPDPLGDLRPAPPLAQRLS
jgi:hypothetical protein